MTIVECATRHSPDDMRPQEDPLDDSCSTSTYSIDTDSPSTTESLPTPSHSPAPSSPASPTKPLLDQTLSTPTVATACDNSNGHSKQGEQDELPFSLVTHPAVVYAADRLGDAAYTGEFHTVNVFDFDQTLFQSPLPNPALWDPSFLGVLTSWNYCGTGWWHNPGTLELGPETEATCWQGWWNEDIVKEVKKSSADPGCLTVLLTGRNGPTFGQKLIEMVGRKGLDFDLIATKPTTVALMEPSAVKSTNKHRAKATSEPQRPVEEYLKVHTFNTKHDFLYNLLFEYPAIRTMHLFDDRPCQVAKFRQAGQEWLDRKMLDRFEMTVVQEPLLYMDPKRETELVMAMVEANNRQVEVEESGGPFLVPGVGPAPEHRRLKIEVNRVVRYTGVMFSEPVQRIMREHLIAAEDTTNGSSGSTVKEMWIERPSALRSQDLSKWVVPDDLHVTLCLGPATPEYSETIGGLGATVLVEVDAVGAFEERIWALKVKEMDMTGLDREVQIVAPNGEIYPSVEALQSAYDGFSSELSTSAVATSALSLSETSSNINSTSVEASSDIQVCDSETLAEQEHKSTQVAITVSLAHVDLGRMGRLLPKKDMAPHITLAYDRLNGTRAMDSGHITQWEAPVTSSGDAYPRRLVFVGTIAEKQLMGMKSRKGTGNAVAKAEISVANIIKSLSGDKDIPGRELGEMIRCVKEEMERLSVENRLANEERIQIIAQEVCDRFETMKGSSHCSPVLDCQ
ncbi:unnamed protein product [Mortierella alpina]